MWPFDAIGRMLSRRPSARTQVVVDARPVRARYDAAQSSGMNSQHWAAADALDADSANSLAVRRTLTHRSRYETANNGYVKGMTLTQANYIVGRGPKLRMQTGSPGMNSMVEAAWSRWANRVKLARKLRTAVKAKTSDGEGFLIARQNPNVRDVVKLDIVGIEADQFTSPNLPYNEVNRIDGIMFDEWGNPVAYELLKYHPGSAFVMANTETEQIPAKFVFHLFREDRPGQHRAVPEISSTLNLGAISRRYREATVVSAENIANFSLFLKTQETPENGADLARPFSSMPIEKGMMTALPAGIDAYQPKPEQPPATYDTFIDSQVAETARPLNQSKNIAMCDSSGYSFSGGKLDHLTYFVGVDTDQADIETLVLDPLFELWFAEAVLYYGWTLNPESPPAHSWDWPARPQIDEEKTATARKTNLSTGVMSLRRAYAEDGLDFDDELPAMAEDYGVSVDEMRKILLESNFAQTAQPKPQKMNDNTDPPPAPNRNGTAPRNGFARSTR